MKTRKTYEIARDRFLNMRLREVPAFLEAVYAQIEGPAYLDVLERSLAAFRHTQGQMEQVEMEDSSTVPENALSR